MFQLLKHNFYSTYFLEVGSGPYCLYCDLDSWTFDFCKTNITMVDSSFQ
jgi:hypothetical protein